MLYLRGHVDTVIVCEPPSVIVSVVDCVIVVDIATQLEVVAQDSIVEGSLMVTVT